MRDADLEQCLKLIVHRAPASNAGSRNRAVPGPSGLGHGRRLHSGGGVDELSGYGTASPVDDIDVLYFDAEHCEACHNAVIEETLRSIDATLPWSVRNQARMHIRNGD